MWTGCHINCTPVLSGVGSLGGMLPAAFLLPSTYTAKIALPPTKMRLNLAILCGVLASPFVLSAPLPGIYSVHNNAGLRLTGSPYRRWWRSACRQGRVDRSSCCLWWNASKSLEEQGGRNPPFTRRWTGTGERTRKRQFLPHAHLATAFLLRQLWRLRR